MEKKNNDKLIQPEVQINSIWIAAIVPALYLLYGWLFEKEIHIAIFLVLWSLGTFGIQIIFNSISTYLVDSNKNKSASIITLFNCIHLFLETYVAIIEVPLEKYLGIKWMFTLFILSMILSNLLIVIIFFQRQIMERKKYSQLTI